DSTFDLPEERKTAGFEKDIKVSGDVDTLAIASMPEAGKQAAKPKPAGAGGILLTITGLLFVGLIIAIIYAVTKSRGATAESLLNKLGVQLPGEQPTDTDTAPAAPAIDPTICPFCGQHKDATGNCACSLGAAPASPFAAPAAGGVPRLIGSQGTYSGTIFEITGGSVVIGREESNNIALPNDTTVSRRHATITAANGGYSLRDEGSSNGTFVNGARITEQKLTPGDEVQIGATKFRFEV
ncbi:MAG: FHA domain-containing protein, partial [Armatimonadetes bacterium]|nr:FHA domain-containing protein [Armatimonadota bacterium]